MITRALSCLYYIATIYTNNITSSIAMARTPSPRSRVGSEMSECTRRLPPKTENVSRTLWCRPMSFLQ